MEQRAGQVLLCDDGAASMSALSQCKHVGALEDRDKNSAAAREQLAAPLATPVLCEWTPVAQYPRFVGDPQSGAAECGGVAVANSSLLAYHLRMLEFLASLVQGRNAHAIQAVEALSDGKGLRYSQLVVLMLNANVPFCLRTQACNLLRTVYADPYADVC